MKRLLCFSLLGSLLVLAWLGWQRSGLALLPISGLC